jgi:hypothetical protein
MNRIARQADYWLKVVFIGMVLGFSIQSAQAWTNPTSSPPLGNLPGPVNTSPSSQVKPGGLGLSDLVVTNGVQLNAFGNCTLKTNSSGVLTCGTDLTGGGGGGGTGTVTQIDTGPGLTGGPITTTGTIGINTANISTCTGTTQKVLWDSTNNRFTCGTDQTGGGGGGGLAGSGTANKLSLWTSPTALGDSIVSQLGTTGLNVGGGLASASLLVTNGVQMDGTVKMSTLKNCTLKTDGSGALICGTDQTGGGGGGSVGPGTANKIPMWTTSTTLGDSILTQVGNIAQVNGGMELKDSSLPIVRFNDGSSQKGWVGYVPGGTSGVPGGSVGLYRDGSNAALYLAPSGYTVSTAGIEVDNSSASLVRFATGVGQPSKGWVGYEPSNNLLGLRRDDNNQWLFVRSDGYTDTSKGYCINGNCITSWPTGGGASAIDSSGTYTNTNNLNMNSKSITGVNTIGVGGVTNSGSETIAGGLALTSSTGTIRVGGTSMANGGHVLMNSNQVWADQFCLNGVSGNKCVNQWGSIPTVSDARLKQDVQNIQSPLEKILALRGVTYRWDDTVPYNKLIGNKGDHTEVGLIAQEVQKVVPEVVGKNSDGYNTVDYQKLTAVLIEAVKEQQKEIDDLRGQVDSLKR